MGQLLLRHPLTALKSLARLIGQTRTMDEKGSPAQTSIELVEWYLLSINPFFDYWFGLPSGHKVLMLDWARTRTCSSRSSGARQELALHGLAGRNRIGSRGRRRGTA